MWLCNSQGFHTCSVCEADAGSWQNLGRWPGACCALPSPEAPPVGEEPAAPWPYLSSLWGANSPPDGKDEGLMDPYCVWRLFLVHGWRHGRSWAAPINDLWGHRQEFMSHSVFCLWLRKKTWPSLQGRSCQRFLSENDHFSGNDTLVKIGQYLHHQILMTLRWWDWSVGQGSLFPPLLTTFLWLWENSLAFHLGFLPIEGRWVYVNNWERQLMNILTKNNYYL